jgi:hypothetical protein
MNDCLLLSFTASIYTKQNLAKVKAGGLLLYCGNDNDMHNGRLGNDSLEGRLTNCRVVKNQTNSMAEQAMTCGIG